ncbi:PilZ domain-containing protein [Lyngbya aestuarii]|uniref:PilZ domain-containing protein n=1 Tax=Lyngbya aestuarii TaxID=118322 RepID=UPI00403DCEFB
MDNSKVSPEKRGFERQQISLFCKTQGLFRGRYWAVDISRGGARIYSDRPLKVGESFQLKFFVPGSKTVTPTVRVAWIKETTEKSQAKYEIGLQFLDISETCLNRLLDVPENVFSE